MNVPVDVQRGQALSFFRSLADETRLRMVGVLAGGERSVEELAAMLDVKAPTVSQHLARLRQKGLVTMRAEGTTHLYKLDMEQLRFYCREALAPEKIASFGDDVAADAWERQVLSSFFRGGQLIEVPASRKKRMVVLRYLAGRFEPGRGYAEAEVNAALSRHHPDFAALRRYLVDEGLMTRQGGVYRRA